MNRHTMESQLHMALKNLSEQMEEIGPLLGPEAQAILDKDPAPREDAHSVLAGYWAREACLPEWAVRVNEDGELVPGTQLFTKDGRAMGNGMIYAIAMFKTQPTYAVVTDIGTDMGWLFEREVLSFFHIGDYIMDPKEGYRTRTGEELEQG